MHLIVREEQFNYLPFASHYKETRRQNIAPFRTSRYEILIWIKKMVKLRFALPNVD